MGQHHCAARSSGGTRTPSSALRKGSGDDCHCGFGMEGTYCVQHYICILVINTNNPIYIFDINGGKQWRACSPSLIASNGELMSALADKGGARAAVLSGTNVAWWKFSPHMAVVEPIGNSTFLGNSSPLGDLGPDRVT